MAETSAKLGAEKKRRDGSGSVYQQKDGTWRAQIRYYDAFSGKSKKVTRRAQNRDDAREALKKLREDTKPAQPATADMTVAEYLDRYVANTLPTLDVSARTKEIHETLIENPLKPTVGKVKLSEFDAEVAEKWLARLQAARTKPHGEEGKTRELAGSTKHKAFYVLATALDVAVRDDLIAENPVRKHKPPRAGRTVVPSTSASDFDNVILPAVAEMRIAPLVAFIGLTGCRLGEALGLQWTDVDLTRGTATLRRSGADTDRTKNQRVRTVPLLPEVVTSLKARRKVQREDQLLMGSGWQNDAGLVFTTFEGRPMNPHNARKDFQAVLRREGLNAERPYHSLRHGLAARLLQRDIPMHVVSAILGHSSIKLTVDTYGHVEPVMHAEALAKAMGRATSD